MKTEYEEVKEILIKHDALDLDLDGIVDTGTELYEDLFEYYSTDPDYMPYGTQKARDGDPVVWITERLDDIGAFEKETA